MKKILISLCLLSIFITGCSDSNENNEHTSGIVSDSQSITENEVTETETDVTEKNETDETISTIDVEAVYAEAYNEAIKQRDISKPVEYSPITITKEVKYGNLLQNMTSKILPGMICPDTENDILYFTNLSNGETLSKLENGVVTELLPVTAKSINLWDGYLYYICDTENPVGIPKYKKSLRMDYTGDIYRYNLATGENELLIDTNAFLLIVSEYGLDYSAGQNYEIHNFIYRRVFDYYHADFNGINISKTKEYPIIDDFLGIYYGQYQFEAIDGAMAFKNVETGEIKEVLSRNETCDITALVGDVLYYRPNFRNYILNTETESVTRGVICGLNLKTGELFQSQDFSFTTDYTIIGDNIYICTGMNFAVYENGKLKRYITEMHGMDDWGHDFIGLYTDGQNLYIADDRKGIYIVEKNEYDTGMIYYEIGGTPWTGADS